MKPTPLQVLARLHGIQNGYRDASGVWRSADPEALLAVMRRMDLPAEHIEHPELGIGEVIAGRLGKGLSPVNVLWEDQPSSIPLSLAESERGAYEGVLELENGDTLPVNGRIEDLEVIRRHVFRAQHWLRRRLPLAHGLPWGYHRLVLRWGEQRGVAQLICSPRRAAGLPGDGRASRWGAFLPLYAARSASDWGAGDFSDLGRLLDWAGEKGFDAVGTLPLLPTFLEEPFNPSPYSPVSRCFWSEFFVDPRRAPEFADCREAQDRVNSAPFQEAVADLRKRSKVEYAELWALKRPVLEALVKSLRRSPERWKARIAPFVEKVPTAPAYARFRARQEEARGRPWTEWSPSLEDREASASHASSPVADLYLYAQALADEQLNEAARVRHDGGSPALYLDLPLGAHPDGFDSWYYRESFVHGISVGAPPDPIFTGGQDWGFAPVHPERIRTLGYRYFIDALRHHTDKAGILRIDHAMCFHRLFWVPTGMGPRYGVYVHYAAPEFYAILTLESRRSHTALVGEDLGTVPHQVRRDMEHHGISRTYAMQLELRRDENHAMNNVPDQAVACVNTHDLPPFAAFWEGADIEERFDFGLVDEEEWRQEMEEREEIKRCLLHDLRAHAGLSAHAESPVEVLEACLRVLGRSLAGLTLINLEDLWGERRRQNLPGSTVEHPNWQHRARHAIEDLDSVAAVQRIVREIALRHKRSER